MGSMLKNGGGLLMDCLIALGGTKGFGVPGESYLAVLDAMYDRKGKFDLMLCRNEGGAAYMAEAWGKVNRNSRSMFCDTRPRGNQRLNWYSYCHAEFNPNDCICRSGWCWHERPRSFPRN